MREIMFVEFPEITKFANLSRPYTIADFMDEFVWPNPMWSKDEGFRATFKRCEMKFDGMKVDTVASISEQDFERIATVLLTLDFTLKPGTLSIAKSLRRIVNYILDSPLKEESKNNDH